MSGDAETARKVGQRHGKPIIYTVDAAAMHADGYKFFRSVNGVWLTKTVPVKYLHYIKEDVYGHGIKNTAGVH